MAFAFDIVVLDFLVVLIAAFLATVASQKLRFPLAVGLIFMGVLLGPNALGLVQHSELINVFAEIGAVLLLFYVGIEFDFSKLIQVAAKSVFFAFFKVLLVFVALYETALLLGLDTITAALIGFTLSLSSTAIMIKILEQKKMVDRSEVPILIAVMIIEDIIAVIGITLVSSLDKNGLTLQSGFVSISISILTLGLAYLVLSRVLKHIQHVFNFAEHEDALVFFSLTLCLALSVLAFWLGLSAAIGAFLAGSLISGLQSGHLARKVTHPLGLAFTAIFFISIGMIANPNAIAANALIIGVLVVAQIVALVVLIFGVAKSIGFDSNQAAFSATALAVTGEFSLLFAREASAFTTLDLVGIASLSVLITALVSSILVDHSQKLLGLLKWVPKTVSKRFSMFCRYVSRMIASLEYGGKLHRAVIREAYDRRNDIWKIVCAGFLVLFINQFSPGSTMQIAGQNISTLKIAAILLVIVVFYSAVRILFSLLHIWDVFAQSISDKKSEAGLKRFIRNSLTGLVLVGAYILFPLFVDFLQLPALFKSLRILVIVPALVFFWLALRNLPVSKNGILEIKTSEK